MPTPLSEEELSNLISQAINTSGASSVKDMGKVLGILKPQILGRADMSNVSRAIKASLGN